MALMILLLENMFMAVIRFSIIVLGMMKIKSKLEVQRLN